MHTAIQCESHDKGAKQISPSLPRSRKNIAQFCICGPPPKETEPNGPKRPRASCRCRIGFTARDTQATHWAPSVRLHCPCQSPHTVRRRRRNIRLSPCHVDVLDKTHACTRCARGSLQVIHTALTPPAQSWQCTLLGDRLKHEVFRTARQLLCCARVETFEAPKHNLKL